VENEGLLKLAQKMKQRLKLAEECTLVDVENALARVEG
jgi:hypothetical protein